jgi:hypothetical protein
MNPNFFIFFLPLTILFLIIALAGVMYLLMGLYMLRTGLKENNGSKTSGGSLSILLAGGVVAAASWAYVQYVWMW